MDETEIRIQFERWLADLELKSSNVKFGRVYSLRRFGDLGTKYDGEYQSLAAEVAWQAWQAARATSEVMQ